MRRRQIVQKAPFLTLPIWKPPKDIVTKSGETHIRDRALPSCNFYADRPEISVPPWAKIHIFLNKDSPGGGGLPSYAKHF